MLFRIASKPSCESKWFELRHVDLLEVDVSHFNSITLTDYRVEMVSDPMEVFVEFEEVNLFIYFRLEDSHPPKSLVEIVSVCYSTKEGKQE